MQILFPRIAFINHIDAPITLGLLKIAFREQKYIPNTPLGIAWMFCDNKISAKNDTRNPATPPQRRTLGVQWRGQTTDAPGV